MLSDEEYQEKIYGYGLAKKYSQVFKYCRDRTRKTPFSSRGFELPKGWVGIIDDLAAGLLAVPGFDADNFEVAQIKEKFGALRFYYQLSSSEDVLKAVRALVDGAEAKSAKTCEVCGAPAQRDESNAWIQTVCEAHAK